MTIKKAYVDIADGQIHYYEGGSGDTPIVFLHQNVSGGTMFLNTMEKLIDKHRCIAFDLPGFGGCLGTPAVG